MKRVREETGIPVEVISGDEEARLTVAGALSSVRYDTPGCLIFDIGGGSTEYVYVKEGVITDITSTGLGVVRLTEQYLGNDTDTDSDIASLSRHIDEAIADGLSSFPAAGGRDLTLIGTAGTPTTLAAIELGLTSYNPALVNNFTLTREMAERTFDRLMKIPKPDRITSRASKRGERTSSFPALW